MDASKPTDRLTEREKQALRGWLEHKTAKEIAIDLGISHYAVEKRLKMARTKLDVATSLKAARMLAASDDYQQAVAQAADLATSIPKPDKWFTKPLILGVIGMNIIAAGALVLAIQGQGAETAAQSQAATERSAQELEQTEGRAAQEAEMAQSRSAREGRAQEIMRESAREQFELDREFVPADQINRNDFELAEEFVPQE